MSWGRTSSDFSAEDFADAPCPKGGGVADSRNPQRMEWKSASPDASNTLLGLEFGGRGIVGSGTPDDPRMADSVLGTRANRASQSRTDYVA